MSANREVEKSASVADPVDRSMLTAALAYAEQGIAVFPLHNPLADGSCSCGSGKCGKSIGKHPRTSTGLKAATTDREQIRRWWTDWPDANIGIPTGAVNGLVVVDVDYAAGEESLGRMTDKYGPLPATKKVKTGNGYQLYFRHPGGKVKSAARFCREYPNVDSRGDGGYVVAPPSLHYSGVRYTVDRSTPSELAEMPGWLPELINAKPSKTQLSIVANDGIPDGSRNCKLASVAGSMRARGMTLEAIEAALLTTNEQQCNPPLPDDEVRAIARSIANYPPGSPNDVLRTLTDAGNADRFARQWGTDVRYVPELKCYMVWNGTHWELDSVGAVMEMAKATAREIYAEGNVVNDSAVCKRIAAHCIASQGAARLKAMLELAESIPALVVPMADLDADRWLLGVENGTLDLREGCLVQAKREDYITTIAPIAFDPAVECPIFLKFLREIMGDNEDLVAYLQRAFGYVLTGDISEQCLFFFYGTGANGKSTLLNVLKGILGAQLCRQTPAETIMARTNSSGATPELACLKAARAVMTTEVDEGSFLSEALVKQMTGGEPISARHLYSAPFEFVPSFKLFVSGNHKLVIRGTDYAIWRRNHMVPFTITIPPEDRDPRLAEKLRLELPGVLNWALQGCLAWQTGGLKPPAAIVDAVAEYKEEMDFLGQWLSELCEGGADFTASASEAYISYRDWARVFGLKAWSNPVFGRKLKERFRALRRADGIYYCGFRIAVYGSPQHANIQKAKPVSVTTQPAPLSVQQAVAEHAARADCQSKGRVAIPRPLRAM